MKLLCTVEALKKIDTVTPEIASTGLIGVDGIGTDCGTISKSPISVSFFATLRDLKTNPESLVTVTIQASYVATIQLNS